MDGEALFIKWHKHLPTLTNLLVNCRDKELYTDVTLACGGKFFPVHKLILSMCSDYFNEVFERSSCKSPVVILKDIKPRELAILLDYMYTGEVSVQRDELPSLMKTAECLHIKGFSTPSEDSPINHLNIPEQPVNAIASSSQNIANFPQAFSEVNDNELGVNVFPSAFNAAAIKVENEDIERCGSANENETRVPNKQENPEKNELTKEEHDAAVAGPSCTQEDNSMEWGGVYNPVITHDDTLEQQMMTGDNKYFPSQTRQPYEKFCHLCHKWFKISSFRNHMRRTHASEKPYACDYCPYHTSRKDNLDVHVRIHTGEKPYICQQCPYRSTTRSQLNTHMKRHTGKKPFSCPHCDYSSTQVSNLKKHIFVSHSFLRA